jgi:hypothetical protein
MDPKAAAMPHTSKSMVNLPMRMVIDGLKLAPGHEIFLKII